MVARWRTLSPLLQDVLTGLGFAFVWFSLYEFWRAGDWRPTDPHTYYLAGMWSAAALALRRVAPRAVLFGTAVLYPLFYGVGGTPLQTEFHLFPILIAGYGATVSGRVRPVLAALVSMAAAIMINAFAFGLRDAITGAPDRGTTLFYLFAITAVVYLGDVMRRQRDTATALADRNTELERLRTADAARAVAEERTRIARELHDVVAHHLVALIVKGQAVLRLAPTSPGLADESMGWMVGTARDALASTRQTVKVLRTEDDIALLAPEPTLADLGSITRRISDAGLHVVLDIDNDLPNLDDHTQLTAVRIAQEALTNVLRHARAQRAVVTVRSISGGVFLQIEDDGTTDPPEDFPADGHGVMGMRERAASCGGTLEIDSGPLGGWRVKALLPATTAGR